MKLLIIVYQGYLLYCGHNLEILVYYSKIYLKHIHNLLTEKYSADFN